MVTKRTVFILLVIIILQLGYLLSFVFPLSAEAIEVIPFSGDTPSKNIIPISVSPFIPKKISFAGEEMPIQHFDVAENLTRELTINVYWQSHMIQIFRRSTRYFPVIESILKDEGVPLDFKYLCVAESNLTNAVSPKRAVGYWQILAGTGKDNGLIIGDQIDERYHLEKATRVACNYLKKAYNSFGSWAMAAAAYNMGNTGLKKQVEEQKTNNYYELFLNAETARYLYRITSFKLIMEDPRKYGFYISDYLPPLEYEEIIVSDRQISWVDFAKSHGINYKLLRKFNPWIRKIKLENPKLQQYVVKIPTEEYRNLVYRRKNDNS